MRALIAISVVLAALCLACGPSAHGAGAAVGTPATDFTLRATDGRQLSLSDQFGRRGR
jgi:hypothetical protein